MAGRKRPEVRGTSLREAFHVQSRENDEERFERTFKFWSDMVVREQKRTEIWFTQFDARHRVMSRETTRSGLILP